jgi:putative serine/threonine protein kinase
VKLQNNKKTPLQPLIKEKFKHIICYPAYTQKEYKHRLKELKKLNIKAIKFTGQKNINNIPILGKGHVGIVVAAYKNNEKVALKIRRTDANRRTMQHEAQMLKKANKINVAPHLLGITKNFLVMEYIGGTLLPEWIKVLKGKNAKKRLRHILHLALEQAWKLDTIGLDHGELSNASKHIIVKPNDTPCLVDFETASVSRTASNVTSLCQFFFIGSPIAKLIQGKLGTVNKQVLVNTLRTYKENKNRKNFENVLLMCRVFAKSFLDYI